MNNRLISWPTAVLGVLMLVLIGCPMPAIAVDSPENKYAADFRVPDKNKKILILPVQSADPDLVRGEEPLGREIFDQLKGAGYQPVALKGSKFEEFWTEILRQVSATTVDSDPRSKLVAYARAVGTMAKIVSKDAEYSMTLSPVFIFRTVELRSDRASWDGVTRTPNSVEGGWKNWGTRWRGTTVGLSLQLLALGEDGRWLFTSYGGVLLPTQADLGEHRATKRDDLFEDKGEIEEGVRVALQPLLKR